MLMLIAILVRRKTVWQGQQKTGKQLLHLLFSLSSFGTTQYRHNQSEVELRHYIVVNEGESLKAEFFDKEIST